MAIRWKVVPKLVFEIERNETTASAPTEMTPDELQQALSVYAAVQPLLTMDLRPLMIQAGLKMHADSFHSSMTVSDLLTELFK